MPLGHFVEREKPEKKATGTVAFGYRVLDNNHRGNKRLMEIVREPESQGFVSQRSFRQRLC